MPTEPGKPKHDLFITLTKWFFLPKPNQITGTVFSQHKTKTLWKVKLQHIHSLQKNTMPAFILPIGLPVAALGFLCCLMFSVENFLDKDWSTGSKGQTLCHTHTHTQTHHYYYSPWRRSTCSIAVRLIQHRSWVRSLCVSVCRVLLQDDSFTRSSAEVHESGCEAAPAETSSNCVSSESPE